MNEQFIIKKREVVGSMSFSKAQLNAFNKYGDRFTRKKRQAKKNKKKAFARMLNSTLKGIKMSAAEYYEQELENINMSESKEIQISFKEMAAMHLKVPMSGNPWLDEMIQKSRRDEFAKSIIEGGWDNELIVERAFKLADALIKAADKGMGEK